MLGLQDNICVDKGGPRAVKAFVWHSSVTLLNFCGGRPSSRSRFEATSQALEKSHGIFMEALVTTVVTESQTGVVPRPCVLLIAEFVAGLCPP